MLTSNDNQSFFEWGAIARLVVRSRAIKSGLDAIQAGVIPACSLTFAANIVLHSSASLQNVQCHATNRD